MMNSEKRKTWEEGDGSRGDAQGGKKRRTEGDSINSDVAINRTSVVTSQAWPVPALAEQLHQL